MERVDLETSQASSEGTPRPPPPDAPSLPPAAPGAVTTGEPPGVVPPNLPPVPTGPAGPSAGPGAPTVPSPEEKKGNLGPLLPRTYYGINPDVRVCFLSFTKSGES